MADTLPKGYEPHDVEARWRDHWQDNRTFTPDPDAQGEPFSIVIPPPNVTGALHIGHALNQTLIDVLCRHARQKGKNVLWVPGTDHAGIATQNAVSYTHLERLAVVLRHAGGHALLRQTALQICKLVVQPLVCWGILAALGVEGLWLAVSVIMAASGSALVVPVLADVHHAGPEEATLTALVSNGLSLFSLSFFIWVMRLLGHI